MTSVFKTTVAILVLAFASGCEVKISPVASVCEADLGSHHVVVKPGSHSSSHSSRSGGGTDTHEFTCGDVSVTIKNETLIVNNIGYGNLKPGEAVLVDHGKVFVADQERKGSPIAEQETQ